MKYHKVLTILFCSGFLFLSSCKEAQKEVIKAPLETLKAEDLDPSATTTTQTSTAVEAPQNAMGVWHYTCSQGCAGGSGTATNCTNCGGLLAHNAGYHSNQNTPAPAVAEPSQNAAGVWHYTCGNGCTGGSGTAGNCNSCGTALAHNQAYHL